LAGPPGVGKSEIAREYAHRFGYDYDLVWWIPAHDPLAARAGLLRLAEEKLRVETGDAVRAVLDALSSGEWFRRSLLIYDNAERLETLAGLLPDGVSVDVLISTRDSDDVPGWETIEVAAFDSAQGRDLLCGQVAGLSLADGERIADALDRLPLALRLATGWLNSAVAGLRAEGATVIKSAELAAEAFLDRFGQADPGTPDEAAAAVPPVVARVLAMVLASMGETRHGRLAIRVAQLCAFLSPEGAGIDLLRSAAITDRIRAGAGADGESLRLDTEELDQVLWTGTRYGLFEVSWGHQASVVMHRALQALARGDAIWAGADRLTKGDVLAGLAAYAPTEAIRQADARGRFDELQKHLFSSGALYAHDDMVRRWIVNHGTYLLVNGDGETWRYTIMVAEKISESWRSAFGPDDELLLRLDGQIANLHRALGHHDQARELDEAVLDIRRRTLGLRHRQTLVSTRGRAADLRSLGRYEEAYLEDNEAWEGLRAILGDDHENTRRAAHNLAISAYLVGDVNRALQIQRDDHERQLRLFGRKHPRTWTSAASVGIWLRELGDYPAAMSILMDASQEIRKSLRAQHPDVLWIEWQLAIARRRQGNFWSARDRNTATARVYLELFGEDHPNTRGCTLSLAADHHALGDTQKAIELATGVLDGYRHIDVLPS
jgi:hypothetical protein